MDINISYDHEFGEQTIGEQNTAVRPLKQIWEECMAVVRARVNNQSYKTWFEPISAARLEHNKITLKVPSQFFCEWLNEHYYSLINEVTTQVLGAEIRIEYEIAQEEIEISPEDMFMNAPQTEKNSSAGSAETESAREESRPEAKRQNFDSCLNPRYTFENYINGDSNQFARAAALAVANNPEGTSFNPLVIYGGVGLGKTHLVQAIGNHLVKSRRSHRVLYISSETFTVAFLDAIQKNSIGEFSNFYRSVDLLIVDDIQFFGGKEKTQDYFFHTFNALHQQGKQIVLSSDRPPKELKGLNERLISRFQWGLTADVQSPDLETRIAILLKKSNDDKVELPHDVIEFIALNVTSNIRELEGCLIGLLARASLESRKIDLDLAKDVVNSVIGEVRTHVTIEEIQRIVSEELRIPEDLIRAKTRKQEVVLARQIAMYLAKELTNSSLKTIGLHFGGRDHSTVIHAYQTIEDAMSTDPKQKSLVQQIRSKIENGLV
ncbi:MAG TPA: chromosomal replication initiator protein DnaA [Bacteroidota bacterium]|nr:chromosomal replication initiator protein DnaA [Bacteroidota bacterium]